MYTFKEDKDFIDGLSFTSDIKVPLSFIPDAMRHLNLTSKEQRLYHKHQNKVKGLHKLYHKVAFLKLSKSRDIYFTLCMLPKKKRKNGKPISFLRIDFNPSKFRIRHYRRLIRRLIDIFGIKTTNAIIHISVITGYDYAIDLGGLKTSSYIFRVSYKQISEFRGDKSTGLSLYIGKWLGSGIRNFYRLYDKTMECTAKGRKFNSTKKHVLRIEYCRRLPSFKMDEWESIKYPLTSLKCYRNFYKDPAFDKVFISTCKKEGLTQALHNIKSIYKKKRYTIRLNHYEVNLIDHELHAERFFTLIKGIYSSLNSELKRQSQHQ